MNQAQPANREGAGDAPLAFGFQLHNLGPPLNPAIAEAAARALNADERHDAALVHAYIEHTPLEGAANIDRAVRIYQHASTISQCPSLEKNVGNILVRRRDGSLSTVADVAMERQH